MTTLNLPETAKIIKKQKCPVKSFLAGNYAMRSGFSPLAEISIACELDQANIDTLVFEIEQAKGVSPLELPYISSSESYLVQEYKVIPIVFGDSATLELKMVQQRKSLIPENLEPLTITHVPLDDSSQSSNFRIITKQLAGGVQASKSRGTFNSKEQYWSVRFLLSLAEAQAIDQQLVGKRGIHPFKWSPNQDPQGKERWFCADWELEYFANDLHIFSGQFLRDEFLEKTIVVQPPIECDPLFGTVGALLPLRTNFTEVAHNLATFGITAIINPLVLDPFGNTGVAQFDGTQAFRLPSTTLNISGDFSIEMWFKPTGFLVSGGSQPGSYSSTILELRPDSQGQVPFNCYFIPNGSINIGWINNISNISSSTSKVILNSWNYLNISRQGTTFRVFVNGELVITINSVSVNTAFNNDWYIGGFKPSPPFDFKGLVGYMSNFRFSQIYRDGSVIPIKPFPTIGCAMQEVLTYQSPEDANGVFYAIGSNHGSSIWSNPITKGISLLSNDLLLSDAFGNYPFNTEANLVDRSNTAPFWANGATPNNWLAIDLGVNRSLKINGYWLKARTDGNLTLPRNWKLQGTNNISTWTIPGINNGTWTDINIQTNNTGMLSSGASVFISTTNFEFRYFRIVHTGYNSDFIGIPSDSHSWNYLLLSEIELYGTLSYIT